MASPKIIVDWLNNVGAYFAQRLCMEQRYESFEGLESALRKGLTGYAKLDGIPSLVEGGLVVTEVCPFQRTMFTWRRIMGDFPKEWEDAVKEYEERGEVANSPACIFHNNYRRFCSEKIFVKGKPCNSQFIACKSPLSGKMKFNEKAIRNVRIDRNKLDQIMKKNICAFHVNVSREKII